MRSVVPGHLHLSVCDLHATIIKARARGVWIIRCRATSDCREIFEIYVFEGNTFIIPIENFYIACIDIIVHWRLVMLIVYLETIAKY